MVSLMRIITLYIYNNTKQTLPQFLTMNRPKLPPILTTKEYESLVQKYKQEEKDKQYCYKPYRTIHNY